MTDITQELVKEFFDYDPLTGLLTWRHRDASWFSSYRMYKVWNGKYAGRPAGTLTKEGYLKVSICNRRYQTHRVIFLLLHGYMPEQVDHENRNRAYNTESNLRAANDTINRRNVKKYSNNKSGVNGVHWRKRSGKWRAQIGVGGKPKYLGEFDTVEAAAAAREVASRVVGYHPTHGV